MSAASLGALARAVFAAIAAALALAVLPVLSSPVLAQEGGGREDADSGARIELGEDGVTVVDGATISSGGDGPADVEGPSERSGEPRTIEVDGALARLLRERSAAPAEVAVTLPTATMQSGAEAPVLPETGGSAWTLLAGVPPLFTGLMGFLASLRRGPES